jgi:hypothetical protein
MRRDSNAFPPVLESGYVKGFRNWTQASLSLKSVICHRDDENRVSAVPEILFSCCSNETLHNADLNHYSESDQLKL